MRNPYFDFLRGFAIIMVVGIHTFKADTVGFETLQDLFTMTMRMFLNCAVPLFLAISGYFIGAKKIELGKSHIEFLKRQIPKVYIPCLIFSLPYMALAIYSSHTIELKSLAMYFACGFSIYYFIALIIQYYLLAPVLTKFNNSGGVIFTCLLSVISILAVTYVLKYLGISLPLLAYAGPFPLWIMFFFLGIYLSAHNRSYNLAIPVIIMIIGLGLQILEHWYWHNQGGAAWGIKLSSFIFSAGIIFVLFSRKMEASYGINKVTSVINWIGGMSFGIYLIHCFIIMASSKISTQLNWIESWLLVLSVTVLFIWGIRALMPAFSRKYLGFN